MKSPLLLFVLVTFCFSFSQPLCSDNERTLLLQFKNSFAIEEFASGDSSAYPKTDSWGRNSSDCCVWAGVECDKDNARVTGLDLSSSFLFGFISSNCSLFGLTHLRRLDLADNDFNYSQIPSSIGRLSELTYLNLSLSVFSGKIPYEILSLSRLSFLDLSSNVDPATRAQLLELQNPGFHSLTESLISLKLLNLAHVAISAEMPRSLANSSSLEYLDLSFCRLKGSIPSFIGKFHRLRLLDLTINELSGQIPSLLQNLTRLEYLDLSGNDFESGNLSWLGSLTKINYLILANLNLIGPLPSSLGNLTRLVALDLRHNQLTGPIPFSFARLVNLEIIRLYRNNLSGEVDLDMFLSLKNLTHLVLSHNVLSVILKPSINETVPPLVWLALGYCNLIEFPEFLKHQNRLELLQLNSNRIGGNILKWLWNMSSQTLEHLNLQENFLTGRLPPILPFVNLLFFIVTQNSLTGPIPIPPPSIFVYEAINNSFSEIPTLLCNLSTSRNQLGMIDLSSNQLKGKLSHSLANCKMLRYLNLEDNKLDDIFPHWLGSLPELQVLLLGSNRFNGEIIKPEDEKSQFLNLQIISLSYNNFSGVLPSSYFQSWKAMQASNTTKEANYSTTSTDNGDNRYFLNILIKIKGLDRYYAKINDGLSIIDFSHNHFTGVIPKAIENLKGLRSLDLSSNSLRGNIPSVGYSSYLEAQQYSVALRFLPTPSSLNSLQKLESLDLSANRFSGKIPQELTRLTFLQYFNVSYNHLVGSIPQGGQLNSFASTSYEGNSGLCGIPLQKTCEAPEPQLSSFEEEREDSSSPFNFGWKVVAIGYGCGFAVGLLIGKTVIARKPRWFAMTFRVRIFK